MTEKTVEGQEIRRDGVKAIIYLQRLARITVTEESAGRGWDKMDKEQQAQTLLFYDTILTNERKKYGR